MSPADDATVNEIIATAQKRNESANSVPMSISAASGDQLAGQGITTARDLVKLVPGFTFADSGTSVPIFSLRGIGFFETSLGGRPTVSIYTDEAPIPFGIEARGASFDLARVDVLKGPQGTLFGQNATGGAINYIAAKPTSGFEAGADVSYSSFNAVDISGFLSGPVSDTLRARVAIQHQRADGWQSSYARQDRLGSVNFTIGRLLLDWTPTEKFSAQLSLNGWVDRSETQAGQYSALFVGNPAVASNIPSILAYPLAPQKPRAADWDPNKDYTRDSNFYQANLGLGYSLTDDLELTSITSFSHADINQYTDLDGTGLDNAAQNTLGDITSISEELRLAGDVTDRIHFVDGGNYAHDKVLEDDFNSLSYSSIGFTFVPFGLPSWNTFHSTDCQRTTAKAVFGNVDFKVTDNFTVSGGVRYTNSRNKFSGCTFDSGDGTLAATLDNFFNFIRGMQGASPNPVQGPGGCFTSDENFVPAVVHDTLYESNVSWRANVEWKPLSRTLLYANVSEGYKAGGFPSLGALSSIQFRPVTQESVLAYEVGLRQSCCRNRCNSMEPHSTKIIRTSKSWVVSLP